MNGIDVIFYIQSEDSKKIQKMIHGVLLQKTLVQMKWIVCGNITDEIQAMFANINEEIFYVCGETLQEEYRNILSLLSETYFTIITDEEEWIEENYLQSAISFLEKDSAFSMYGANVYDEDSKEYAYNLKSVYYDGMYDPWYEEYISYSIDDFYYHLALNRKMQMFILPRAVVYRNYPNAYEELFERQEDIVLETVSLMQMLYFANLKYGMSILKPETIGYGKLNKLPKWKQHMVYALMVYAIRTIYKERNPRWISEYVNLENYFGIKILKEEIQNGYVPSQEDMFQIDFLHRVSESLPKGNPFIIKNLGEKNPEKIFLVLEFERRGYGLFATVFMMLGAFKYANDNNLIPIIDLKNHYVRGLQCSKRRFLENSWEYYFEQPVNGFDLEEVYSSQNVMVCDEQEWCNPTWYDLLPTSENMISEWNEIIRKYLRLKPEVQQYIDESFEYIWKDKKNVLGVNVRAGYIRHIKLNSDFVEEHPVQFELEETIKLIKDYMKRWECEWIFLVADDAYYFREIQNAFKEKCLYLERNRGQFFEDKDSPADIKKATSGISQQGIVENNIDYICETYLLARCDSLLAGNCGCSRMAYFLNNNQYEHVEIIDKGKY